MPAFSCDVTETEVGLCNDAVDIETALNHVGVGPFQWLALLVCGLANAADAVEILGMSLVLPAAEGDPNFELTTSGKSALSSCIFLGMLLGGLLWGPMGDVLGRRQSLIIALLINAFFGMMSAGARSVGALVAMRLLGGVGVGGSVPVVFSFLTELLPARSRGRYMVGLAAHWMVGSIFSAGMGWAIIPTAADGWRVFLAVASLPVWCAALGTLLMPESPRFLLVQGQTEAAEQVLQRMAAINKRHLRHPIKLIPHQSHHLIRSTPPPSPPTAAVHSSSNQDADMSWQHARGHHSLPGSYSPGSPSHHCAGTTARASSSSEAGGQQQDRSNRPARSTADGEHSALSQQQQLRERQRHCCAASFASGKLLFQQPLRRRFLPLLVAWLGLCGGWYSTVLWIPEYFKARGAHSASLYAETFAVAAANLPGNIASIFMVDWLGRRLTACVCLAGACVAALLFAFAPADPVWSVAAACIFNGISVGGWNALDLLSAELFATEVRSTAMGLLGAGGRLASFTTTFMAGALMQILLWSPLLVAAGLLAAGSIAIMLLPEMAHKPLEDTVEDAQDCEVVLTALTFHTAEHRQHHSLEQQSARLVGDHLLHAGDGSSREGLGSHQQQQQRGQPQVEMELTPTGQYHGQAGRHVGHPQHGVDHQGGQGADDGGGRQGTDDDLKDERLGLLRATAK